MSVFAGSKSVGLGVIGCGRIGRAHLAAAEAVGERVRLVGIANRNDVEAIAAAVNAPFATTDYRRLLEHPEVDAVVVATPTHHHVEVVLAAAQAGKHVLVEKPMALDAAGGALMVDAMDRAGRTLMVAQSRRFPLTVAELVRRLPEIGPIFRIHVQFLVRFAAPPTEWWRSAERAGGLVILLQGSHSVDSVMWWLGAMPNKAYAITGRRNPAWEGEDEADITLRFPSGAVATVHLSLSTSPAHHEALVVGEKGHFRLIEWPTGEPFGFGLRLEHDGKTVFEEVRSEPYRHQLDAFVTAVMTGEEPPASGQEVLSVMRVLDSIRASAARNAPVVVR